MIHTPRQWRRRRLSLTAAVAAGQIILETSSIPTTRRSCEYTLTVPAALGPVANYGGATAAAAVTVT